MMTSVDMAPVTPIPSLNTAPIAVQQTNKSQKTYPQIQYLDSR